MPATLDMLSRTRSAAVRAIPLEKALERIRRLAIADEIRHSDRLLRIIHEFESAPAPHARKIPTYVRVVDPNAPDAFRLHFADPRRDARKTFCGVSYVGWKLLDRIATRAALQDRRSNICRRCRRSLELALERCRPA